MTDQPHEPPAAPAATDQPDEPPAAIELVDLVQSFADALPDDLIIFCRRAIVEQRMTDATLALGAQVLQTRPPVTRQEAGAIADILIQAGVDPEIAADVGLAPGDRHPVIELTAEPPGGAAEGADSVVQHGDAAVLSRLEGADVIGVWRAWRRPVLEAAWPPGRPIYLVETRSAAARDDVLVRAYGASGCVDGPDTPMVEPYIAGTALPPYHSAILVTGTLLFAAEEAAPVRVAGITDAGPDDDGSPSDAAGEDTAKDEPPMSTEDAERAIRYLTQADIVLRTDELAVDPLDPDRGEVLPLDLRTDGTWVWSDATAYFLIEHGVPPEPEFAAYLATCPPEPPTLTDTRRHQIVEWLRSDPNDEETTES
ncbi:MAG: hypothetical protein ACRCXL_01495 [Dermatophilaceae bacterium]